MPAIINDTKMHWKLSKEHLWHQQKQMYDRQTLDKVISDQRFTFTLRFTISMFRL